MVRQNLVFIVLLLAVTSSSAQYLFSGYVDEDMKTGQVYLSLVEDYRKVSGLYPEQILAKTVPDSSGYFQFAGTLLPKQNRMYRIHVDNCGEEQPIQNQFTGHCLNSKEILFIANATDQITLPFSFDQEMFCKVVSTNEKAHALLEIDSMRNEMNYVFGSFPSETKKQLHAQMWFERFQEYGQTLEEPLAELYIYSFLSDRRHPLHSYYLQDLADNPYYDELDDRLQAAYPETQYAQQYSAELAADTFIAHRQNEAALPWWVYLLGSVALLSLVGNYYFFGKSRRPHPASSAISLSQQEQKILDLILQNKTNKEIASDMFVSVSTVKTHINNLYRKLQVESREEVKARFQ